MNSQGVMRKTMLDKSWFDISVEFLFQNFWAFAGALLSLFMTQKVSWWRGLLSFAVGFTVAVITPNIVAEFYPIGEFTKSGIAFMSGTCGYNFTLGVSRIFTQWKNDPSSIASDWIKIFRGQYKDKIHKTDE